ncbi:MAG TPA: nuclear transport factor 2 family protein [Mycobacterium sp.]|nr:nuclear transport factor 2 family protein [Mycobacterium sp.]
MNANESLDFVEIQQLLARYSRSLDTRDWELYRSVFTEDAYIDYAASGGTTGQRDHVVEWLGKTLGTIDWSGMHYITNIEAEVKGDSAHVRAAVFNPMQFPGMKGLTYFGGYYHHNMIRTSDGWRSCNLREEILWSVNAPLEAR